MMILRTLKIILLIAVFVIAADRPLPAQLSGNGGGNGTITGTGCLPGTTSNVLKGDGSNGCTAATAGLDFAPATSGTAILKGNNTGGFSNATASTDYAPATSGSSILKGNGTGGFSNATASTDYAPATSGSAILKGNGTGGFSAASSGTDYAPATSGSAILKGDGAGGFSSASSGTDYQAPVSSSTPVANQFVTGFTAPNTFSRAQPSTADISGLGTIATNSDPLTAAHGGTGVASPTAHSIPIPEGVNAWTFLAPLADDQLLAGSTGGDPIRAGVPNCGDSGHALAYSTSTHTFSCQSITGSAAAGGTNGAIQYNNSGPLGGVVITGLVAANGTSPPTVYGGTSCTNKAITALDATGAATCNTITTSYTSGIAASGANSDITSLSSLSTPLSVGQGGTGASTAGATAANNIGAAAKGANSDITSLSGLTTPLTVAQGGFGLATLTAHSPYVGNGTSAPTAIGVGGTGTFLYGQVGADPIWSTLTMPNAATKGDFLFASGTNAIGNLADVAVGRVIVSSGVGANPGYSATPTLGVAGTTAGTMALANGSGGGANWTLASGATGAWTLTGKATVPAQGDLFDFANGTGTMGTIADVATGQVLASGGVGAAPAYTSTPTITGTNITGIPTGGLLTTQGTSGTDTKVQLATGTTTTGDVPTYDATGGVSDSGTLLTSLGVPYSTNVQTSGSSITATCTAKTGSHPSLDRVYQPLSAALAYHTPATTDNCIEGDTIEATFTQASGQSYQVSLVDGSGTTHVGTLYTTPTDTDGKEFIHFLLRYRATTAQWELLGQNTNPITPAQVAQGGTGTASTLTGLVRGSASAMTAAELSGDATTSGSNAVSVVKVNGNTPGGSCTNQAVTSVDSSARPSCTTLTSAYVNNSVATTGGTTDLDTSSHVTSTHLSAGLPVNQGGTGLQTLTAHAVQVGEGTSAPAQLGPCITGQLIYGQTGSDPICSATPTLGTAASANGTITLANGSGGGAGWTLASGATTGWTLKSTATVPGQGSLFSFSNAAGQMDAIPDVATGQVLASGGMGAEPGYSATPTLGVATTVPGTLTLEKGSAGGDGWTLASGATTGWTLTGKATVPAQGDLFTFADGAGTMSTIADVATGQVLASGGVGAAPSWQTLNSCTSNPQPGTNTIPAATAGDVVCLGPGTYNLTSTYTIGVSNFKLRGKGWGSTIITQPNGTNLNELIAASSQSQVTVEGMTIDCNRGAAEANNPTGNNIGVHFTATSNSTITGNIIQNCRASGGGNGAITLTNLGNQNSIWGNVGTNDGQNGVSNGKFIFYKQGSALTAKGVYEEYNYVDDSLQAAGCFKNQAAGGATITNLYLEHNYCKMGNPNTVGLGTGSLWGAENWSGPDNASGDGISYVHNFSNSYNTYEGVQAGQLTPLSDACTSDDLAHCQGDQQVVGNNFLNCGGEEIAGGNTLWANNHLKGTGQLSVTGQCMTIYPTATHASGVQPWVLTTASSGTTSIITNTSQGWTAGQSYGPIGLNEEIYIPGSGPAGAGDVYLVTGFTTTNVTNDTITLDHATQTTITGSATESGATFIYAAATGDVIQNNTFDHSGGPTATGSISLSAAVSGQDTAGNYGETVMVGPVIQNNTIVADQGSNGASILITSASALTSTTLGFLNNAPVIKNNTCVMDGNQVANTQPCFKQATSRVGSVNAVVSNNIAINSDLTAGAFLDTIGATLSLVNNTCPQLLGGLCQGAASGSGDLTSVQHAVQVASLTTVPSQIGPSATIGTVLTSAGSSADPAYASLPFRPGFFFGTPTASQTVSYALPGAANFPANFTSSTWPDTTSVISKCSTNPSEDDTYNVYCDTAAGSPCAGTLLGTVKIGTAACAATLATTGGTTQSCAAGNTLRVCAPATVSGTGIAITLAGHTP
jgi:hypothetical protein